MKLKTLWVFVLLFLSAYSYAENNSHSYVKPCQYVAVVNVQRTSNTEEITITRGNLILTVPNSQYELCVGDIVSVSSTKNKSTTTRNSDFVFIYYYNERMTLEKLTIGQKHTVRQLFNPCKQWCKSMRKTNELLAFLTEEKVYMPLLVNDTRMDLQPISTRLTDGKPLYLFSGSEEYVHFFWRGGTKPYTLTIRDSKGHNNTQHSGIDENETWFRVSHTSVNKTYTLSLTDKYGRLFRNKLVFRTPPLPMKKGQDELEYLAILLSDPKRNWRLQVWQALRAMPETSEVTLFKAHLRATDF
ncbi:hypothetical protein [Candidatus Albibeggiatoa sp. nov. BB20]|uniref:hypothetical protein n=1 Tax=Candidatus Albibeggiatoa sp. nov. BB20 TaxID=3162723 RepID=UPI003365A9D7